MGGGTERKIWRQWKRGTVKTVSLFYSAMLCLLCPRPLTTAPLIPAPSLVLPTVLPGIPARGGALKLVEAKQGERKIVSLCRARLQREIKTLEEVSIKTWHSKLSVWNTGEDTDFKLHSPIVPLDVCRGGFKAK
ncbi:hypothetical protein NQZ68_013103 [Dissostichus eleginoides]|nr:hypothetical protein NQZ68_013103 [Dissostichus eleginoides]